MPIHKYNKLSDVSGDLYPSKNDLVIELTNGNLYFVNNASPTKLYYLVASTGAVTQIDVDTVGASGDGKSRIKNITRAFHDRSNSKIYFGDCNYSDVDHAYVWSLNYGGSYTSPSITEEHVFDAQYGTYIHDIVKIGSNIHVFYYEIEYDEEIFEVSPDGDEAHAGRPAWENNGGPSNNYECVDEASGSTPDTDFIDSDKGSSSWADRLFTFETNMPDMSVYDGGFCYDIKPHIYAKNSAVGGGTIIDFGGYLWTEVGGDPIWAGGIFNPDFVDPNTTSYAWYETSLDKDSVLYTRLNQDNIESLKINIQTYFNSGGTYYSIECFFVEIYVAGDLNDYYLKSINLTSEDVDSQNMGSPSGRTHKMSRCVVIGDDVYFIWKWSDENAEIWKYDQSLGTFTEMEDCGSNTDLPDSENQWGISYDESDLLYFVLKDTSDTYKYLYTYSISGDVLTKRGLYNISLMLNRNTNTSNDPPYDLEKGFHLTDRKIYQIASTKGRLFKIADLTIELADGTIVGITDSYLFIKRSSNDIELWEFVDFEDEIMTAKIRRNYGTASSAVIVTPELLGNGIFVQLYKGTETESSFKGYIKKKEYDGYIRTYECIGQEKELYKDRFTDDLSSVGTKNVKNIMEYLIDTYANFCDYTSSPDSIDPDSDFTTTYANLTFTNKTLHEAFSVLMDLEDGIYSVDGDGIIYAWAIANIPSEEKDAVDWVVNETTGEILGDPRVTEIQEPLNKIIIYGPIVAGARLKSIANDLASQNENGVNDYVDHFPHIYDLDDLNDLADAILNKTGLINPIYLDLMLEDDEKRLIGRSINVEFNPYIELADPADYYIIEMEEDLKQLVTDFKLSSGLVQVNREEEVDIGKTSNADEEQIDILGIEVKTNADDISDNAKFGSNLPIGTVLMYKGAAIGGGDTSNILTRTDEISVANGDSIDMQGWYVCNGVSSTPNLHDRFIRCELDSAGGTVTGGADTHTLTIGEMPSHAHGYYRSSVGGVTALIGCCGGFYYLENWVTSGYNGSGGAHNNMPSYFSVIFIIKMS